MKYNSYYYEYENTHSHWKVFSYSGGPTQLPRYVAHKIQKELLNYNGSGVSILETNHMSQQYHEVLQKAVGDLRFLYNIPQDFKILFCAGGGTLIFDALPLNLLRGKKSASYLQTGYWSQRAINEANILCPKVDIPTEVKRDESGLLYVPEMSEWNINHDSAYLHYCDNETVEGLEYPFTPKIQGMPLIADMSSNFLTRKVDWASTDVVYAHAQKNIGIAGSAICIIRESLIDKTKIAMTPYICDFEEMIKQQSLINTVPVFPIYVNQQVFSWMKNFGDINEWEDIMNRRPEQLYNVIDSSHGFYKAYVAKKWRSRINVTFTLENAFENQKFLDHCENEGLIEIKGHRNLGGCRISLYVPVPQIAIDKLAIIMEEYAEKRQ